MRPELPVADRAHRRTLPPEPRTPHEASDFVEEPGLQHACQAQRNAFVQQRARLHLQGQTIFVANLSQGRLVYHFNARAFVRGIVQYRDLDRNPDMYGMETGRYIEFGASPRASIYLALAARGHALVRRRDYVVPDDVKAMLHDVVRHRIAISYRAEAEGLNSDALLDRIVERVPVKDAGARHAVARP